MPNKWQYFNSRHHVAKQLSWKDDNSAYNSIQYRLLDSRLNIIEQIYNAYFRSCQMHKAACNSASAICSIPHAPHIVSEYTDALPRNSSCLQIKRCMNSVSERLLLQTASTIASTHFNRLERIRLLFIKDRKYWKLYPSCAMQMQHRYIGNYYK